MLDITGKKVAVIGLSKRTGVSTAKMLVEHGARVIVSDVKTHDELVEEMSLLENYDIDYELGGHGQKCLSSDLIVVSPGVPLHLPFFNKVKEKGIPVISEIELAYHFCRAKIIAITGTNGKTTTTSLLGEILKTSNLKRVKVAGNIGIPLIKEVTDLTSEDWVVAEVSSFQLETILDFRPAMSIYLNFTPDHLDRHKTKKNYWEAKKKIFKNQRKNDFALINYDDTEVVKAARDCKAEVYGISLEKDLEKGVFTRKEQLFIKISDREEPVLLLSDIPLIGPHNIQNVAFAVLAASLLGVKKDIIKEVIKKFKPVEHRLQVIGKTNNNVLLVDDSKGTNPDAAIKALKSFEQPIILIAGGQDRNANFDQLAETIKEKVKSLILMGETKDKLAKQVLNTGFKNIYKVKDMKEAVCKAVQLTSAGDCLLLSPGCPSWDMYPSYRVRGKEFRQELRKYYLSAEIQL